MIPVYDVDLQVAPPLELRVLTQDEVENGWLMCQSYGWPDAYPWDEIDEALLVEEQAIDAYDAASNSVAEFEAAAEADADRVMETLLGTADAGVGTLMLALNAAGFVTGYSCRGHPPPTSGASHPVIVMAADRAHLDVLVPLVAQTGCGVDDFEGSVRVYATNVRAMLRLARAVVSARDAFDALPAMYVEGEGASYREDS